MPKHSPVLIWGSDLYGLLCNDPELCLEVSGVPRPDYPDDEPSDVLDEISDRTDEAIKGALILGLVWHVSWPDHVTTPRYNGDATYASTGHDMLRAHCENMDALIYRG